MKESGAPHLSRTFSLLVGTTQRFIVNFYARARVKMHCLYYFRMHFYLVAFWTEYAQFYITINAIFHFDFPLAEFAIGKSVSLPLLMLLFCCKCCTFHLSSRDLRDCSFASITTVSINMRAYLRIWNAFTYIWMKAKKKWICIKVWKDRISEAIVLKSMWKAILSKKDECTIERESHKYECKEKYVYWWRENIEEQHSDGVALQAAKHERKRHHTAVMTPQCMCGVMHATALFSGFAFRHSYSVQAVALIIGFNVPSSSHSCTKHSDCLPLSAIRSVSMPLSRCTILCNAHIKFNLKRNEANTLFSYCRR